MQVYYQSIGFLDTINTSSGRYTESEKLSEKLKLYPKSCRKNCSLAKNAVGSIETIEFRNHCSPCVGRTQVEILTVLSAKIGVF